MRVNRGAEVCMIYVELLRPESMGRIELRSGDARDKPIIHANYLADERDVATLLRGIKFQAAFVGTTSFRAHEAELIRVPLARCNRWEYASDDYWRCYAAEMSITVYHPVGTVRMGPIDDGRSVVDPELRVIGVRGLRVIDASIMPNIVGANTNAATIMIGEKGADFIRAQWTASTDKDER